MASAGPCFLLEALEEDALLCLLDLLGATCIPSFVLPFSIFSIFHLSLVCVCVCVCVCARPHSVAQSYLTLWHPMDCSPPGSTVHEISQARILEWVAIFSSRGSSRDGTCASCIAGRLFRTSVTLRSSLSLTTSRRDSQHLKEIMRTSAHLENAG